MTSGPAMEMTIGASLTAASFNMGESFSLSRNWVLGISLHERVTHLLCLRLEFSEATLVITNFKLRKDGVVKRLPCFDQMVEDAGKFVGRVLDGLGSTMPCALRAVVVAR